MAAKALAWGPAIIGSAFQEFADELWNEAWYGTKRTFLGSRTSDGGSTDPPPSPDSAMGLGGHLLIGLGGYAFAQKRGA